MAAHQRSISPIGGDPSGLRAQAHDARTYLVRLLIIAALTVIVVAVWAISDDPATTITLPATEVAETRITAPPPEVRSIETPIANRPTQSVAPLPTALPRPPEWPEPLTPAEFIRYLVQPGDIIFDIARFNAATVDDLLRFNPGLGDGTRIDVGLIIMIPVFDE
ncbi:MAG TPA: LysM domain-containing protein [Dehalococcoidia bacterium]|nr:LysM domain-containing protein [Dehalococcoidia bacterium]